MLRSSLAVIVLVLLAGTSAQAQQPQRRDSMAAGPMAMPGDCMAFMHGGDHRLGRLMDAMHAAPQNRRMAAMMAVMDELVVQNREMRAHMMGMMHGMQMTGMMSGGGPGGGVPPMRKAPGQTVPQPSPDSAQHEHQ